MALLSDILGIYLLCGVLACHCALLVCQGPQCPKVPVFLPDYFEIAVSYLGLHQPLTEVLSGVIIGQWVEFLALLGVISVLVENLLLGYFTMKFVTATLNWLVSLLMCALLCAAVAVVLLIYLPEGTLQALWTGLNEAYLYYSLLVA
jgi:hypothetical protein